MSAMDDRESLVARLETVQHRLGVLAAAATAPRGLTSADPNTGDQWEAGQVWGHMAEFVPFWLEQTRNVVNTYQGEPVPFGRQVGDQARKAGVDRGLSVDVGLLWAGLQSGLTDLRQFLENPPSGWAEARGFPRGGDSIAAPSIVQTRLLDHLEEHATQLEQLAG